MWIKFCGIYRPEDIQAAVAANCDALGIVMVPSSPRCVDLKTLRTLSTQNRNSKQLVLVFENQSPNLIHEAISVAAPDFLQFHGTETPAECLQFDRPYMKAVRASTRPDLKSLYDHDRAWAWLIDRRPYAQLDEAVGELRRAFPSQKIIEAGGLTPENVAVRIHATTPFGVDVSSGIERGPRQKDKVKMQEFARAARNAAHS